jgi:hypothetical protein
MHTRCGQLGRLIVVKLRRMWRMRNRWRPGVTVDTSYQIVPVPEPPAQPATPVAVEFVDRFHRPGLLSPPDVPEGRTQLEFVPTMPATLISTTTADLLARRHAAIQALQLRFTGGAIQARAVAGTLCDCERDTARELETIAFLLGEGAHGYGE